MFTSTEKKYLALTLVFLATGTGIKAFRQAQVQMGPIDDSVMIASDLAYDSISDPLLAKATLLDSSLAAPAPTSIPENPTVISTGSSPRVKRTTSKAVLKGKVSINLADPTTLMGIHGIGEKTAGLILEYRKVHGPFHNLQDLLKIKGIGAKKLEKMAPFLIL